MKLMQQMRLSRWPALAGILMLLVRLDAEGQDRTRRFRADAAGGITWYDLSGAGESLITGARVAWFPVQVVALEANLYYFNYLTSIANRSDYLFPELSVVFDLLAARISPVAGVGAGYSFQLGGIARKEPTLHFLVGAKVHVSDRWSIRLELRPRAIDPFSASTADLLFSFGRRW